VRERVFVNRTIRHLLKRGWTQRDVAAVLGISKSTVSRKAIRMGLRKRRYRVTYDWEAIDAYYAAGHTLRECRRRFGVSNGALHAAVARGALRTRKQPRRARGETSVAVGDLLGQGLNQAEVARRLGLSKGAVSYHAGRLGYPRDPACARRYDWQEIQRYYDDGHSISDCQAVFGFARKSLVDAVARGAFMTRPQAMPADELFVTGTRRNRRHLRLRLIRLGLKDPICEECGLVEWRGQPLSLQLHHTNGDGLDNRVENFRILCRNCHSQTDNWGGRNARRKAA
jgi:DNA-binding CsgD family transcriptional regulator